ncbi:MAG TPA: DUF2399 domain-containing protein [Longimicrobium sp.]|nr:DUF2399 domain-containing protein [Longimicrobium sp.]
MRRDEEHAALNEALDDPRLERILKVALAAMQKTGDPPAVIRIQDDREADALRDLAGGRPIWAKSIRTEELEARLRANSRFKYSLRQILEIRFGTIVSRRQVRQQTNAEWSDALARLQEIACSAPADLRKRVFQWIEADRSPLRARYVRQGAASLERDLKAVVRALALLPEQGRMILLAELAEQASHDPHAFDAGQSAGSLLDRALMQWFPRHAPGGTRGSALWRRRLLAEAGIQRDAISPRVDTFGLLLDTTEPARPDPLALDRPWTLRSLMRVRGRVRAAHGVAYVFENPTVYESVLNRLEGLEREFDPTLICTNGGMNTADEVLLDGLAAAGTHIFYSGDFDGAGLRIALRLRDRLPNQVRLWHMEADDYRAALRDSGPRLRTKRLERARAALPDLVAAMIAGGRVAYQEALTETLFADIARFTRTRTAPARPVPAR